MKTRTRLIVQGADEDSLEFTNTLNNFIESIYEKYNIHGPVILFPTASASGRQTILLQWQYEEEKTDIMIEGLVNDILGELKLEGNEYRQILTDKITDFIK